jgi:DegV family protein with EDD domain
MHSIRIVTDTTVNMPPEIAERHAVTIVPVYVIFGDKSYKDYVEMTPDIFYVMLAETKARGGEMPKSSQPSPGDFELVYKDLAAQGAQDIISIHVTAKSSGTVNSASIAKDMVASKVRVHVVDSATTSMHMGYMIVEAARVIEAGGTLEQALAAIEHVKENSCLYFTVTEVEHLAASGRTEGADRVTDSAIKVKPVIGILDGRPQVITPERTQRAAIDKVVELTKARLAGKKLKGVTVVHGNAIDRAEALKMRVPDDLGYQGEIPITDFGPALGVHFGPGLLGLVAYAE